MHRTLCNCPYFKWRYPFVYSKYKSNWSKELCNCEKLLLEVCQKCKPALFGWKNDCSVKV